MGLRILKQKRIDATCISCFWNSYLSLETSTYFACQESQMVLPWQFCAINQAYMHQGRERKGRTTQCTKNEIWTQRLPFGSIMDLQINATRYQTQGSTHTCAGMISNDSSNIREVLVIAIGIGMPLFIFLSLKFIILRCMIVRTIHEELHPDVWQNGVLPDVIKCIPGFSGTLMGLQSQSLHIEPDPI